MKEIPQRDALGGVIYRSFTEDLSHKNRDNISEEQVQSNMQLYPMKRYAEPIEIAGYILYLLSDVSSYTTGSNLVIDGGFTIT